MTDHSLGIGILGSGLMAKTYAEAITKYSRGAHLAGITGGSRAQSLADEYQAPCFASLEALLGCDDVNAVIIATPQATHLEQALAVAAAGKQLLVEKPMATRVEDCDTITAACRAKGLKLAISFTQRMRTCNVKAHEMLQSGKLGRILHIHETAIVPGGMPTLPGWHMLPENMGVLLGYGVHNIDRVRWFTGQEIRSVYAVCRNIAPGFANEGTSDIMLTLADGTVVSMFISHEVPKPGYPRLAFNARITCENGLLDVDGYGEIRASMAGGPWETVAAQETIGQGITDPVRMKSHSALVQDFIDSVKEDREPSANGWDGRQAVAVALAAYQSSATRQAILLGD